MVSLQGVGGYMTWSYAASSYLNNALYFFDKMKRFINCKRANTAVGSGNIANRLDVNIYIYITILKWYAVDMDAILTKVKKKVFNIVRIGH